MRSLSIIGRVLFGSLFIVSACLRLNEFATNKELVGKEYAAKMSRPLNLLVRPHVSTSTRIDVVGLLTFYFSVYKIFGGCLLIFNHIVVSIIPLGIYLLLEIPVFCGFYHYKVGEPEFMFLFQDFVQNVSLFGALLFFMDMNLIKMKQDVLDRKEKRLKEMNKRLDGEKLNIVVAYSQESIMSQKNIMREILSWLPVKSLLRFKCVSKSWDITWDPYFRTNHQSRHEVNSQRFLLLRAKFNIYTQYFDDLYSTSSLSSLDDVQRIDYLSSRRYPSMDILCGSCDGLVLIRVLSNREYLLLWNPSTRESIQLPFPIFGIRNSTFGLGYDPTIDDYKILTIHHEKLQTQCGILALRSGSWRNNVDMKAPHTLKKRFGSRFRDTLSFVHRAFHWIPCCFGVASFNISNEVCTEISLSEQMYSYLSLSTTENNHVSVLDGMLCFSSACKDGGEKTFMLWAMKDYGVKESWTQIFKINISHIRFVKPIYRFADGDVLFHCYDYMHDLLSTSKGRFSHPLIQHQDMVEIITFNESLISPKLLI